MHLLYEVQDEFGGFKKIQQLHLDKFYEFQNEVNLFVLRQRLHEVQQQQQQQAAGNGRKSRLSTKFPPRSHADCSSLLLREPKRRRGQKLYCSGKKYAQVRVGRIRIFHTYVGHGSLESSGLPQGSS